MLELRNVSKVVRNERVARTSALPRDDDWVSPGDDGHTSEEISRGWTGCAVEWDFCSERAAIYSNLRCARQRCCAFWNLEVGRGYLWEQEEDGGRAMISRV